MARNNYPVLCGGTFFTLILEARGQRTSQRSRYEGEQDGLSQPETLAGLGKAVYPEYTPPSNKQTFRTNVNAYKSCADDGSNLSFLFPDKVSAFDGRVKNEYSNALMAMCDFADRFLEIGTSIKKETWLVKALLELIETDTSIEDNQELYLCEGGQGITKGTLRQVCEFTLQPFLLGVWHFIVVSRPYNKSGKDTFDVWCPPRGRAERKYEGTMGERIDRFINVAVLSASADELTTEVESTERPETPLSTTVTPVLDADPKRITVNNYGTVENQKFISVETMNGDIHI